MAVTDQNPFPSGRGASATTPPATAAIAGADTDWADTDRAGTTARRAGASGAAVALSAGAANEHIDAANIAAEKATNEDRLTLRTENGRSMY